MRSHFFLIEHASRGVYMSTEFEWTPRGSIPKHHFSWSKLRTDPKMKRFYSLEQAQAECQKLGVPGAYVLEFFRETKPPMKHWFDRGEWKSIEA